MTTQVPSRFLQDPWHRSKPRCTGRPFGGRQSLSVTSALAAVTTVHCFLVSFYPKRAATSQASWSSSEVDDVLNFICNQIRESADHPASLELAVHVS